MYNLTRYNRQVILDQIGQLGQERLKQAKVLCVGAGGLGCPVLQYLCAAGVGTIGIADDDVVSLSNLHRQVLYKTKDQGLPKVLTAASNLRLLNPDVNINTYQVRINCTNIIKIMQNYDVIIDATDNFNANYLINDASVKLNKPVVFAAINGFEGRLSVFWAECGPCYRCLFPEPPHQHIPNCSENGVLGPMVGLMGCMQSLEVIKLITNYGVSNKINLQSLIGKLVIMDGIDLSIDKIKIKKNPFCNTCSKPSDEIKLPKRVGKINNLNITDLQKVGDYRLIDVRSTKEWQDRHFENSINIPLERILSTNDLTESLNIDKSYIVYCQSGARAHSACVKLLELGYKNIYCFNQDIEHGPWKLTSGKIYF